MVRVGSGKVKSHCSFIFQSLPVPDPHIALIIDIIKKREFSSFILQTVLHNISLSCNRAQGTTTSRQHHDNTTTTRSTEVRYNIQK